MRSTDGSVFPVFEGRETCKNRHCCPTCQRRIATARAREIRTAIQNWGQQGGQCLLLTLNVGHKRTDELRDVWRVVADSWSDFITRAAYRNLKTNGAGLTGFCRIAENTYGSNGWHVHLHVLLFVKDTLLTLGSAQKLFKAWAAVVKTKGFKCDPDLQDLRPANIEDAEALAGYVTKRSKWDVVDEVAGQISKSGRFGHETPMDILDRAADGDVEAMDLWRYWEQNTKGFRQISWALNGFRDRLGIGSEKPDQDLMTDKAGLHVAGILPEDFWKWRNQPEALVDLLEVIQNVEPRKRGAALYKVAKRYGLPLILGEEWQKHRFHAEFLENPRQKSESLEHREDRLQRALSKPRTRVPGSKIPEGATKRGA